MLKKLFISLWVVGLVLTFFYSFTQVDLGLTLTRASFWQTIQKSFQYIGYFNRPLSLQLFISLIVFLSGLYLWTLYLVKQKKVNLKTIWIVVLLSVAILTFSYNAFSYDLFNYLFDAKIVTTYGQNPYVSKALDFPGDPYLGFMHWTHRTYPYGPLWLAATVPISFIGFGYFIITFYLFKIFTASFYLLTCFFVYKITKKVNPNSAVFALAFFALNPLVLIESLVSSHHELVMMGPALIGVYFLFEKKLLPSWIFFLFSAGIKFASGFLFPLFLWYPFSKRKNKQEEFLILATAFMVIAIIFASIRTTFQPWYLLFAFPFAALLSSRYIIFLPTAVITILGLFQYAPYLFTGNYDFPNPLIISSLLIVSILIGFLTPLVYYLFNRKRKHN